MNIYCLEDFKVEFEKLKKKNSYKLIESQTIEYFFNKTVSELASGVCLNNSNDTHT